MTTGGCLKLNKAIRRCKGAGIPVKDKRGQESHGKYRVPRLKKGAKVKVVVIVDAGEGEQEVEVWTKAQGGRLIGLMEDEGSPEPGNFALVDWRSGKLVRVTHSSFDGETVAGVEAVDAGLCICMLVEEFQHGILPPMREKLMMKMEGCELERPKVPVEMHTDANCLVKRVETLGMDSSMSKRRKQDVPDLKECRAKGDMLPLVKIQGQWNPVDPLTKVASRTEKTTRELRRLLATGWYEPPLG